MSDKFYYECELLRMGRDEDGCMTADEDAWLEGQTVWNIFVTQRYSEGVMEGEIFDMLDIDIPVSLENVALRMYEMLDDMVESANVAGCSLEKYDRLIMGPTNLAYMASN